MAHRKHKMGGSNGTLLRMQKGGMAVRKTRVLEMEKGVVKADAALNAV